MCTNDTYALSPCEISQWVESCRALQKPNRQKSATGPVVKTVAGWSMAEHDHAEKKKNLCVKNKRKSDKNEKIIRVVVYLINKNNPLMIF